MMGLLSLCRKAGRLAIGFDPVLEAVRAKEAKLVLYAADFSPRSRKRMERLLAAEESPPESRTLDAAMEELARVCGKLTGVAAVTDSSFAAGIEKLMCDEMKEEQDR